MKSAVGNLPRAAHAPPLTTSGGKCGNAGPFRVIYFIEYPLTAARIEKFGISRLANSGLDVTVVDVGHITQPTIFQDRNHYKDLDYVDIRSIEKRQDLTALFPQVADANLILALISTSGLTTTNLPVWRFITSTGTPYALRFTDAFPGWNKYIGEQGKRWKRVRHIIERLNEIDILNSILTRLPPSLLGVRQADYVVYGGRKSRLHNRLVGPGTREIHAHSTDYQSYIDHGGATDQSRPIAVFIDEYLPFHPDLVQLNTKPAMSPDEYFEMMRVYFDYVEKNTGLEVVIAACPHANYSDKPGIYGNRRIEYFKTLDLIAQCRLVIGHRSTAIGFGVMCRKPIILVASRQIYRDPVHRSVIDAYAEALATPINFIDREPLPPLTNVLEIDGEVYDTFMDDYVRSPDAPRGNLWEIVLAGTQTPAADRTVRQA